MRGNNRKQNYMDEFEEEEKKLTSDLGSFWCPGENILDRPLTFWTICCHGIPFFLSIILFSVMLAFHIYRGMGNHELMNYSIMTENGYSYLRDFLERIMITVEDFREYDFIFEEKNQYFQDEGKIEELGFYLSNLLENGKGVEAGIVAEDGCFVSSISNNRDVLEGDGNKQSFVIISRTNQQDKAFYFINGEKKFTQSSFFEDYDFREKSFYQQLNKSYDQSLLSTSEAFYSNYGQYLTYAEKIIINEIFVGVAYIKFDNIGISELREYSFGNNKYSSFFVDMNSGMLVGGTSGLVSKSLVSTNESTSYDIRTISSFLIKEYEKWEDVCNVGETTYSTYLLYFTKINNFCFVTFEKSFYYFNKLVFAISFALVGIFFQSGVYFFIVVMSKMFAKDLRLVSKIVEDISTREISEKNKGNDKEISEKNKINDTELLLSKYRISKFIELQYFQRHLCKAYLIILTYHPFVYRHFKELEKERELERNRGKILEIEKQKKKIEERKKIEEKIISKKFEKTLKINEKKENATPNTYTKFVKSLRIYSKLPGAKKKNTDKIDSPNVDVTKVITSADLEKEEIIKERRRKEKNFSLGNYYSSSDGGSFESDRERDERTYLEVKKQNMDSLMDIISNSQDEDDEESVGGKKNRKKNISLKSKKKNLFPIRKRIRLGKRVKSCMRTKNGALMMHIKIYNFDSLIKKFPYDTTKYFNRVLVNIEKLTNPYSNISVLKKNEICLIFHSVSKCVRRGKMIIEMMNTTPGIYKEIEERYSKMKITKNKKIFNKKGKIKDRIKKKLKFRFHVFFERVGGKQTCLNGLLGVCPFVTTYSYYLPFYDIVTSRMWDNRKYYPLNTGICTFNFLRGIHPHLYENLITYPLDIVLCSDGRSCVPVMAMIGNRKKSYEGRESGEEVSNHIDSIKCVKFLLEGKLDQAEKMLRSSNIHFCYRMRDYIRNCIHYSLSNNHILNYLAGIKLTNRSLSAFNLTEKQWRDIGTLYIEGYQVPTNPHPRSLVETSENEIMRTILSEMEKQKENHDTEEDEGPSLILEDDENKGMEENVEDEMILEEDSNTEEYDDDNGRNNVFETDSFGNLIINRSEDETEEQESELLNPEDLIAGYSNKDICDDPFFLSDDETSTDENDDVNFGEKIFGDDSEYFFNKENDELKKNYEKNYQYCKKRMGLNFDSSSEFKSDFSTDNDNDKGKNSKNMKKKKKNDRREMDFELEDIPQIVDNIIPEQDVVDTPGSQENRRIFSPGGMEEEEVGEVLYLNRFEETGNVDIFDYVENLEKEGKKVVILESNED